ncbi:MAG: GIY-YIG nuclease family protein [Ignavibacteriae bacterium]|nr:GIY-YIG nuclease family protein [Ignavibacteriota bacterium]
MYITYVLISDEGFHYTGSTEDLELRLQRHREHTTHFTKKGTNWRVIYTVASLA